LPAAYRPHGRSGLQRLFHERFPAFDSCGYDCFRPFSCKAFFFCPSRGQKRTILLGEYLADDLLLRLPHWHTIVLEGGFDTHDRFFFIPIGAGACLQELWRNPYSAGTIAVSL
jgi:hypothetical protein